MTPASSAAAERLLASSPSDQSRDSEPARPARPLEVLAGGGVRVLRRYAVAVVLVGAGLAVAVAVREPTDGALTPLLAAIAIVAWTCGPGPAMLATSLGVAGAWFFLLDPLWSFHVRDRHDVWRWVVFVGVSAVVVAVGHRMRLEQDRARRARVRDHEARILVDRLRQHARAIAAESAPERVAHETVRVLADAGVAFASVRVVRSGTVFELAAHGVAVPAAERDNGHPLADDRTALADVLRTGEPVTFAAQEASPYPDVLELRRTLGAGAGVALPLRSSGGGVSGMVTAFLRSATWPDGLGGFVAAVAEQCGVALDRALTVEAESRSHARGRLLAALVDAMETATTVRDVAQVVSDTLVPRVADFAWVEVRNPGQTIVAAAPRVEEPDRAPVGEAADSRARPVDWELLCGAVADGHAHVVDWPSRRLDRGPWAARSLAALPLHLSDGEGVILLGLRQRSRRPYAPEDLPFLEEIAERAALRLDNALLQEQAQDVARRLQQALLPTRLADTRGMRVAACYYPGAHELHVGGDWYDAIEVSPTRVVYTVGDVVGKGVGAAAVMGRVRSALRALAHRCTDPADILRSLESYATAIDGAEFATLCCCDLDIVTGRLRYVQAGHPPMLLIDPAAGATFIEDGRTTPLLVRVPDTCVAAERTLEPGSTLLFYSDGLVERRDGRLLEELDRLKAVAASLADVPLPSLPERIVQAMVAGAPTDDVVVLAVRYDGAPAEPLAESYPATPTILAHVRRDLRAWLRRHGVDRQDEDALVLAVSEAGANAVEHAYGDGDREGVVAVEATSEGDTIVVSVRDNGTWRSEVDRQDRGRGTAIMTALTDELERESTSRGTTVTMRKHVRVRAPVAS